MHTHALPRPATRFALLAVLAAIFGFQGAPAHAQAQTRTVNTRIPVIATVAIPDGEAVQLSGTAHVLFHVTRDNAGGFHLKAHVNGQGISGTGQTSGAKYQGTSAFNFTANVGAPKDAASEFTGVANVGLIGEGRAPDLRLHLNVHGTVNANGEVTATVANARATRR